MNDLIWDLPEIMSLGWAVIQTFVKQSSKTPSIHRFFYSQGSNEDVFYIGQKILYDWEQILSNAVS